MPESSQQALAPGLNWLRARYDAAVTTHENRRHWSHADGLSADAAGSPEVRRTLRNRARYEIANNSYAKGIVLTLANDVIGTGPRLQVLSGSAEANRHIENEFSRWADAVHLADRLRTLRMSRCSDGESFALLANNPSLDSAVQLDLRLIEADRVTAPDLTSDGSADGITFDAAGNPISYSVLTEHPGNDTATTWLGRFHRYPANSVIHYFRTDRPGQSRGIPDITAALPLFAHLRRFTLAVIAAAEIAALPGGVLYTDAPPNGEATDIEPMDLVELERGMLMTMPGGWKMGQLKAEQPTTTYGEFKREILKEIARCLNMPYNVAAGDSSNHNYASGRLDHQTYFKSIRVEQRQLETTVLDRILAAWLDEATLIPGVLPDGIGPTGSLKHQWFWDGHEHVDPAKEARAQAIRLSSLTTTLADEYAKRGLDWETQLRQRAAEQQLLRELGLSPQTQPPNSQVTDATDRIPAATAA